MKKIILFFICILLIILKLCNADGFLSFEIKIGKLISNVTENNKEVNVASTTIDVLDYYQHDGALFIKPSQKKVVLPFSGLITNIKERIIIESDFGNVEIYGVASPSCYIYQYYEEYSLLGLSDIVQIKGNYDQIISKLRIIDAKI